MADIISARAAIERAIASEVADGPTADALRLLYRAISNVNDEVIADRVFEYTFQVAIDAAATGVSLGTSSGSDDLIVLAAPPAVGANPLGFDVSELGTSYHVAAGYQAYFAAATPIWFRSVDGGGNHDTELLVAMPVRAQVTITEIVRLSATSVEVFVAGAQI